MHPSTNLHLNTPSRTPHSASTKAKENISNFNKLAASVVAANPSRGAPGRAPFGALNLNSRNINPRPTSVVSKKPSGHSHGAKAIKVLGELKATNTAHNGVNASYDFDASLVSTGTADGSRDSTNVKDRVIDWERERHRLREIGRLEDIEKERDYAYKRQKKEKKRQGETGNDEVVEEKVEEVKVRNVKEENISESHDVRLQQGVSEEKPRPVNRKSASHLQIQIPASSRQPIDGDDDVGPRQEAPKMKDGDSDKGNTFSSVMSPVLPMFSTGPRLTQGKCLFSVWPYLKVNRICSVQHFNGHTNPAIPPNKGQRKLQAQHQSLNWYGYPTLLDDSPPPFLGSNYSFIVFVMMVIC